MKLIELLSLMEDDEIVEIYTNTGKLLCKTRSCNVPKYVHHVHIQNIKTDMNTLTDEKGYLAYTVTVITIGWGMNNEKIHL